MMIHICFNRHREDLSYYKDCYYLVTTDTKFINVKGFSKVKRIAKALLNKGKVQKIWFKLNTELDRLDLAQNDNRLIRAKDFFTLDTKGNLLRSRV